MSDVVFAIICFILGSLWGVFLLACWIVCSANKYSMDDEEMAEEDKTE